MPPPSLFCLTYHSAGKHLIFQGYMVLLWYNSFMYAEYGRDTINPNEYDTSEYVNGKRVIQYSIYGDYIYTYKNVARASKLTGISASAISGVCNGKDLTAGNYKWEYAQKED